VVYIESTTTGRFFRVPMRPSGALTGAAQQMVFQVRAAADSRLTAIDSRTPALEASDPEPRRLKELTERALGELSPISSFAASPAHPEVSVLHTRSAPSHVHGPP
jgi:hypothetical protein